MTTTVDNGGLTDYDVAGETISGEQYQYVKLIDGTPTSTTPVGTSANPIRVNPTGTTAQPITDNGGSVTVDAPVATPVNVQLSDGTRTATVRDTGASDSLNVAIVDASGNQITSFGGSGGTSQADKSTFTEGTTNFTPAGGVYNETISADPTEDQAAAMRITAKRALHTNLRNASGTEIATASNPVRTDPTGSTTQPVSGTVTANAGTGNFATNIAQVNGGTVTTVATGTQKVGIADSAGTAFVSAANALNSTGSGVQAAQIVGQFDDVSPTAITENQFGNVRMSANRNLYGTIRDAAGNERGANVNASNQLSVSVDNTVTVASHAVTNAGTFAVQDSQVIADNAAFTDGTSKVFAAGFIYDEVAGTALTENDAAAARINVNRAQVAAIEDGATRGRYATVTASNAVKVDGSAVTQPISGNVGQSGTWTVQPGNTANTTPWLASIHDGTTKATVRDLAANDALNVAIVDASGNQITSFGGSGGTAMIDDAAFTVGTSLVTPSGGIYKSTRDSVDDGDTGALAMTADRALFATLQHNTSGESAMLSANGAAWVRTATGDGDGNVVPSATTPPTETSRGLFVRVVPGYKEDGNDLTALNQAVTYTSNRTHTVAGVQITNTFSATVAFEGTLDGSNWVALAATPAAGGSSVTTTSSTGVWFSNISGLQAFRVRVSAYTSGTVTVSTIAKDFGTVNTSSSGGPGSATEYTEDAVSPSDPTGGILIARRRDSLSTETGTDGDITALNATGKSELYVKHVDAIPVTDNGGSLTVDGTVAVSGTVTVGSHAVTNAGTFAVQENGAALTALQLLDDAVATTAAAITTKGLAASGTDGTNARILKTDTNGELQVDVLTLPALPAGSNSIGILGANSGVDIGDVTINNASGASAVNVQDGGNSLTVDNGGTFAVQDSQTVTDNAGFTDGTSKLFMAGYIYDDTAGTALTENDAAAPRVSANRATVGVIEDGATRARYATVTASNALKVDGSAVTQPVSGTVTASNAAGDIAHDAADSGNPVKVGAKAINAFPTAVANADRANAISDLFGRILTAHIDPAQAIHKAVNVTTTQTGTDVWSPASGKKIAVTYLAVSSYATTSARVILWFGDNADTTYTAGTDQVLWAGSFAPSSTSKPGLVIAFPHPIFCTTADRELHLTTDAGISLDITVSGYEF